ncbi:hypothetical protein ACOJBO_45120 [Rhizobium beringeri]
MTTCIDEAIEVLRAELRNADPAERPQIENELELALAEREVIWAEQDGRASSEPSVLTGLIAVSVCLAGRIDRLPGCQDFAPRQFRRLAPDRVAAPSVRRCLLL